MKRATATVVAGLLLALGAAAPAFADTGADENNCYSLAYESYKQVVCKDADGNTVSDTSYYQDGCVVAVDAAGVTTSNCPPVEPWIEPWTGGLDPNDIACDVESVTDDAGAAVKVVTCRNTDGTIVSQTTYADDGCVTETDADGNSSIRCPDGDTGTDPVVDPWLPPVTEVSCDSEPWFDEAAVEYKLVTCRDADGNVVSKTRYSADGCVTEIGVDGNEYTYCKDPAGCYTRVDSDGSVSQSCVPTPVPYFYTLPADTTVASVEEAADGCRAITLTDGSSFTACPDVNAPAPGAPMAFDERGCIVYADSDGTVYGTDCLGACYFSAATGDGTGKEFANCYGGNTPENMTVGPSSVCDVVQLLVDGQILQLATCDDGCVLVNGMPGQSCASLGNFLAWGGYGPRTGVWLKAQARGSEHTCWQRETGGEWTDVECPKVMYDMISAGVDGKVLKYTSRGGSTPSETAESLPTAAEVPAPSVPAEASASSADVADAVALAMAPGRPAPTAGDFKTAAATGGTGAPLSPAVAALAAGAAGVAGAAGLRVRRLRMTSRRR